MALSPQEIDALGEFETQLTPQQETQYQTWKQQYAPNDSGIDYDFRGAFKSGLTPSENGHWPDTYKKPNHPTFSVESIYASQSPDKAGSWNGDTFVPPPSRSLANAYSPEQIDNLDTQQSIPRTPRPGVSTTAGGPPIHASDTSPLETVGNVVSDIPRAIGKGFGYAGNVARAVPLDVASGWSGLNKTGTPFENLKAAVQGRTELPSDEEVKQGVGELFRTPGVLPKVGAVAGVASEALTRAVPKIAALPIAGSSLLAQSIAAGGLFGLDDEGHFNPKEAIISALLPGVGKIGRVAAAAALGKATAAGSSIAANQAVQKVVETLGEQSSLNAYMLAASTPELVQQYQQDPMAFKQHVAEIIGTNLAFGLLGADRFRKGVSSETKQWLDSKASDLADQVVTKKIVQDYPPDTLRSIYQRVNSNDPAATAEEKSLVQFINEQLGKGQKEAIKKGAQVTTTTRDLSNLTDFWAKYLKLSPGETKTVEVPETPLSPSGRSYAPGSRLLTAGEIDAINPNQTEVPNANQEQSAVAEVRSQPSGPVEEVPGGKPGAVQQPSGTGEGQKPVTRTPASPLSAQQIDATPTAPVVAPKIEAFGNYGGDIDRPMVTVKIGNQPIVFYRSSEGTSGKKTGNWYPMFGFGPGDWIIKGKTKVMEEGYGNPQIKSVQSSLNQHFSGKSDKEVIADLTASHGQPLGGRQLASSAYGGNGQFKNVGLNDEGMIDRHTGVAEHIRSILEKTANPTARGIPKQELTSEQMQAIKEKTIADRVKAGVPPGNVRITINKDPSLPAADFLQVDEIDPSKPLGEGNVWSSNPEKLKSLGMDIPSTKELMTLPAGRYTLTQAQQMLQAQSKSPIESVTKVAPGVTQVVINPQARPSSLRKPNTPVAKAPRRETSSEKASIDDIISGTPTILTDEGQYVSGSDHASAKDRAEERGLHVSGHLGERAGWFYKGKNYMAKDVEQHLDNPAITEKGKNESEPGQAVVVGPRPSGTGVAGEAGSTPSQQSVEAISGSGGGANVATPSKAPVPQPGSSASGTGRTESGQVHSPTEPGTGPGQPATTQPEIQATPQPVQIPQPTVAPQRPATRDPNAENHVIGENDVVAPAGKVTKLKANIEAIMLLKRLETQKRNATPEEKKILTQYTGWGGLSQVFDERKGEPMVRDQSWGRDDKWEKQWGKYYETVKNLMTPEEWDAAARSSQYAHYTARGVITRMWDMAEQLGFVGGTVLEPAAGVGLFFGLAPEAIRNGSRFVGIEKDNLSGRILTKLYPQAKTFVKGFEEVGIPPNSVDLAITNVPFSDMIVNDKNYPKLNLHNYFIARSLDAVKPGGLVVAISTTHTMDSQAVMRQFLASKAELIGAIRLPNTAFKENAGTEVTTDILVLRKPMTPTPVAGQPWAGMKETQTYDGKPLSINEYFADHPEQILGKLSLEGTMYGGREEMAVLPAEGKSLDEALKEAVGRLPANIFERSPSQMVDFANMGLAEGLKDNTLTIRDGALAVALKGTFVDPITMNELFKDPIRVKQGMSYVGLRDTYRKLLAGQIAPETTDEDLDTLRKDLRTQYDAYVKKYGFLNERRSDFLDFEQSYYLLLGLEKENITPTDKGRVTKTYTKADVFTKRTQFPRVPPQSASSLADAIQISNSYKGRLDPEFIGNLLGTDAEKATKELLESGAAFLNPESGLIESPNRYLSGNVRKKLARARDAADNDEKYKPNVAALEKVQPQDVPFRSIRARIGGTWIPDAVMVEFARELFGSKRGGVSYVQAIDKWVVGGFSHTPQVAQTYATSRFNGEELLNYALNQKSPVVYDTIPDGQGGERRVFNDKETTKARVVIDKMQAQFQRWLNQRQDVQPIIEKIYNEQFNAFVLPDYNIARLDLPGASDAISLRANQREAVWRFINEGHGVIAHGVGSGKTFEQIAIAMESRRLGLAKKPMLVVMNSTLGQFANAFRTLYPGANILVATKDDLSKDRRKLFLSRIASGDYDSIIIPQSQFDMLEDDPVFEREQIQNLLDQLSDAIVSARQTSGDESPRGRDPTVKELEKAKEKMQARIEELSEGKREDVVTFQELGIDLLSIDEAHNYKKAPFVTKLDRVAGLERQTSKRAYRLMLKARYIQSRNNGRGVILATGTPITNTLGESWHMLNIASPQVLKEYGVDTFDRFVSTFALVNQNFDVNATGKLILKNRLATFVNGPELLRMIGSSWDVLSQDSLRRIIESEGATYPNLVGGKVEAVTVDKTKAVSDFNAYLLEIYEHFKALDGQDKKTYSYVPVLTFLASKAAALDIRLVKRNAADDPGSKVNKAVENVYQIWKDTAEKRLTQAVFLDSFNPMSMASLNTFAAHGQIELASDKDADLPDDFVPAEDLFLFQDIKRKLIAKGVPAGEILIVNEHDTNKPEASLMFEKVNSGDYRIVMGSTAKMGVGVNIQKRLFALHHLDTPWFPALLEQRNGRIMRPGNMNTEVRIMYYGMAGTIDAGLYAKNEAKAKFAQQILSGATTAREFEDPVGPLIATLQEQMAALSGDPLLVEKVLLESEIRKLTLEKEAFEDDQARKASSGRQIQDRIKSLTLGIEQEKVMIDVVKPLVEDKPITGVIGGRSYGERKDVVEAIQNIAKQHETRIRKRVADKYYEISRTGAANLSDSGDDTLPIGSVNGIAVKLFFDARNGASHDEKNNLVIVTNVEIVAIRAYVPVAGEPQQLPLGYPRTADGLVRAIADAPKSIESSIDQMTKQAASAKNELAEIGNLLNRKYEGGEALQKALDRYQQLQEEVINGSNGAKTAELLFDLGIDPAPLLIRLRNAVNATASEADRATNAAQRAHARMMLLDQGTKEQEQAKLEADTERTAAETATERLHDLSRRLMVVEKARLESESTGEASGMPYGKTPAARPGVAYDEQFSPPSVGEEMRAHGIDAIKAMLNHPMNGLTADARRVAMDMLDQPVMRKLDWSRLGVEIRNSLNGNYSGAANVADWLIQLSKQARSTTFPHELFHFLYSMLPDEDKIRIDDLRKAEVVKWYGENPPKEMLEGKMTSEQALASGVNSHDYYLINPSEFLARFASEDFARDSFRKRNDTLLEGLWDRVKMWIQGIIDSIRRAIGIKPDLDQVIREILAGKRVGTGDTAAAAEREVRGEPEARPEPLENAGVNMADLEAGPTTEVFGRFDRIRGREVLSDTERAAGAAYASNIFKEAGLQVTQQPNGLFTLTDEGFESEMEGRKLLDILVREIAIQNKPGAVTGYLANMLNSVVVNMIKDDLTAFSPELKRDLYAVAQGERSHRGLLLGALAGFGKTIDYVARNVDVVLNRVYSDHFGGDVIREVMDRALTNFRDYFTDDEIGKALGSEPEADKLLKRILALNRRDEGGRVYRKAQALLKPVNKKKISHLEADARVREAVDGILQSLKAQGIEPPKGKNKPLPAIERLLHMVEPKTAGKIQASIEQAVKDAERNAGIKAALDAAETDADREDLIGRFNAGEEPDSEMVEKGLNSPQFAHWKVLRDTLLDYSPTTVKLARAVLQEDFKGLRFRDPKARPVDTRVDINALAKAPEDEVQRVLKGYVTNLEQAIDMRNATLETRQQVMGMVERDLVAQLEAARKRVRDAVLEESAPGNVKAAVTPEQQVLQLLNAGLFKDPRLDLREMVDKVASATPLKRLLPSMADLVKQALQTPFYRQSELTTNFTNLLVKRLGVSAPEAAKLSEVFARAFDSKFTAARLRAFTEATRALTPKERKTIKPGKATWRKLQEAINAGVFDSGTVLEDLAKSNGWKVPTPELKDKLRALAERIQQLSELSDVEKARAGSDPKALETALREKQAATLEKQIALKKQMEGAWARMTQPITLKSKIGRTNIMRAISEFTPANLLLKVGFAPRLAIDIATQGATHAPTRAIQEAFERWGADRSAERDASLWRDITGALNDSRKAWLATFRANLTQAKESLAGRGEARNIDRLLSRIALFERNALKIEELKANKQYALAAVHSIIHYVGFSFRIAQALDNFQGLPAEWQEMRNRVVTALRENGMTRAEAATKADGVMGDFNTEWIGAIARAKQVLDDNGVNPTPNQIKSAAVQIVKANAYANIEKLGLLPDDFEQDNRILRNTLSWGEREEGGLGGAIAGGMRWTGRIGEKLGFPLGVPFVTLTRFSNAIGTGINYKLMHTPLGFFPGTFEGSPWARTERDQRQMHVRAWIGSSLGALMFALAYYGLVRYQARPPQGKAERDLWEKEGHRANTVEIPVGDGKFIPLSSIIGPAAILSPYIAAGAKLHDILQRKDKEQAKLNTEAAKHGAIPGKVSPLGPVDFLAAGGEAAYNALLGGRTAAGLTSTVSEYGRFNIPKAVAGIVSPLVPFLPGYQEVTRMAGLQMDPKIATVFDFMVPLPTSGAARSNILGDSVGTEDALQRIVQIMTGGTFPGAVDPGVAHSEAAYQALYSSGFRPPAIDPNKGYLINGEFRPMTDQELQTYTQARGDALKSALSAIGPTDNEKLVREAYTRADNTALASVNAQKPETTESPRQPGTTSQSAQTSARRPHAPSATVASSYRGPVGPARSRTASIRKHAPRPTSYRPGSSLRRRKPGLSLKVGSRGSRPVSIRKR